MISGLRIFLRKECPPALEFLFIIVASYLTVISVFGKPFLNPFDHEQITSNTTSTSTEVDYAASSFTVLFIVALGLALGQAVDYIGLPPLLGMLLAGMALGNIPGLAPPMFLSRAWSTVLRRVAFVCILLRGGLSLDGAALRRSKLSCGLLAVLPCAVEAVVVTVASAFILGMAWLPAALLGILISAVSPAVIVPAMITITQSGLGSRVSSLIVASAALDNIIVITAFSLVLSFFFSTGNSLAITIIRPPLSILLGVGLGVAFGFYLRHGVSANRGIVLCSGALVMCFGFTRLGMDASGALSVLIGAFLASDFWKRNEYQSRLPEEATLRSLWLAAFQPLLFGIIGFDLRFEALSWSLVGLGLAVLFVGVLARLLVVFASLSLTRRDLSLSERLFVVVTWIPKGTAALASVALEACPADDAACRDDGLKIFVTCVVSILVTAPIGSALIRSLAHRLLGPIEERAKERTKIAHFSSIKL